MAQPRNLIDKKTLATSYYLPNDVVLNIIFPLLDLKDIASIRFVCKYYEQIVHKYLEDVIAIIKASFINYSDDNNKDKFIYSGIKFNFLKFQNETVFFLGKKDQNFNPESFKLDEVQHLILNDNATQLLSKITRFKNPGCVNYKIHTKDISTDLKFINLLPLFVKVDAVQCFYLFTRAYLILINNFYSYNSNQQIAQKNP